MKPTLQKLGAVSKQDLLPFLLPALVFLGVVSWRPFEVGFYHDDWVIIASPATFSEEFISQVSRPAYAIILAVLRFILPPDPRAWQIVLSLSVTISAVFIGLLSQRVSLLLVSNARSARWAGCVAAATWLAYPWTLGLTVWPTTICAQVSISGFCIVGIILVSSRPAKVKLLYGLTVFLAISLISELFWFSFLPLLLIAAAANHARDKTVRPRELLLLLLGFCLIQAFLVSINRVLSLLGVGVSRSFNATWAETARLSLRLLPAEIEKAVLWPNVFWALATIVLAFILLGLIVSVRRMVIASITVAVTLGALGSILIFALASYRIESIGVFSRSTAVLSVWLTLAPAIAVAIGARMNITIGWLTSITVVALIALLSVSSVVNLRAWTVAWAWEQDLLHSFPAEDILSTATPDSFIIVIAPNPPDAVDSLTAFWDMTGAIRSTHPGLKFSGSREKPRFFATVENALTQRTVWNGSTLTQSWCTAPDTPLWSLPAPSDLYVWDYPSKALVRFTTAVSFGCGVPVPTL